MKRLSVLCAIALAFFTGGCADPLEQGDVQEAGEHLQRGLSGQGHLTSDDSINNPTGKSAASQNPGYPQQ